MSDYVLAENGQITIAEVRGWGPLSSRFGDEAARRIQVGNANLIAAAPELLAAARDLVDWHDRQGSAGVLSIVVDKARAAVVKAVGQ